MSLQSTIGIIMFIVIAGGLSGAGGGWLMVRKKFKKLQVNAPSLEEIKQSPDYRDEKEEEKYGRRYYPEPKRTSSGSPSSTTRSSGATSSTSNTGDADASTTTSTTDANTSSSSDTGAPGTIDGGSDEGYDEGIGEPTTGEPSPEEPSDEGAIEGSRDLQVQPTFSDGESDSSFEESDGSFEGDESDDEEDWPNYE